MWGIINGLAVPVIPIAKRRRRRERGVKIAVQIRIFIGRNGCGRGAEDRLNCSRGRGRERKLYWANGRSVTSGRLVARRGYRLIGGPTAGPTTSKRESAARHLVVWLLRVTTYPIAM